MRVARKRKKKINPISNDTNSIDFKTTTACIRILDRFKFELENKMTTGRYDK